MFYHFRSVVLSPLGVLTLHLLVYGMSLITRTQLTLKRLEDIRVIGRDRPGLQHGHAFVCYQADITPADLHFVQLVLVDEIFYDLPTPVVAA